MCLVALRVTARISSPVANGSRVPAWPIFFSPVIFRSLYTTSCEVMPSGLSMRRNPEFIEVDLKGMSLVYNTRMENPQGYTTLDLVAAAGVVLAVTLVIVVFVNPLNTLKREYDEQRVEDVRDLTEIVLELRQRDPERFENLLQRIENGPAMIGMGEACAGSHGVQCPDSLIQDTCLDIYADVIPEITNDLPVDEGGDLFSEERTGYFLSHDGQELIIGACSPQIQSNIEISVQLDQLNE